MRHLDDAVRGRAPAGGSRTIAETSRTLRARNWAYAGEISHARALLQADAWRAG